MTYDTNFHQQPKAFLLNIHEASPPQKFKEALPTDNMEPIDFLMEAEDHWNMVKQQGITCNTDHNSFIQSLRNMEDRDLKEAEKLGNRFGVP